jgi:hypothetical protein
MASKPEKKAWMILHDAKLHILSRLTRVPSIIDETPNSCIWFVVIHLHHL